MHFRSIADLNRDILANLHSIPADIDVVVGIPRSGLLPATLISLAYNLPLADVDGFISGRVLASGRTKRHAALDRNMSDFRHALLVDDSVLGGESMRNAQHTLRTALPSLKITSLAVYGADATMPGIDLVLALAKEPRVFQWNVMHHQILQSACVDIDGILCIDPSPAENDDGQAYLKFLQNAAPLYRPTRTVHALVTSRLEKYRSQTEAWLAAAGIEYDHLVMLDLPNAEIRKERKAHGTFKAEYYRSSDAKLFIESELSQANEIAALSKKPVLWLPGAEMCYPGGAPPQDRFYAIRRKNQHAMRTVKKIGRALIGNYAYARLKSLLKSAT